jgi:hypothetical protein
MAAWPIQEPVHQAVVDSFLNMVKRIYPRTFPSLLLASGHTMDPISHLSLPCAAESPEVAPLKRMTSGDRAKETRPGRAFTPTRPRRQAGLPSLASLDTGSYATSVPTRPPPSPLQTPRSPTSEVAPLLSTRSNNRRQQPISASMRSSDRQRQPRARLCTCSSQRSRWPSAPLHSQQTLLDPVLLDRSTTNCRCKASLRPCIYSSFFWQLHSLPAILMFCVRIGLIWFFFVVCFH